MSSIEYLVDIPMCAYNHEKYIAQAIEGVVMQQTDFPYRLIIGEDCSKDNTRAIVRSYEERYPDKIKVLYHEHNLGAYDNSKLLFQECRAEYIALCDGDDYWTDSTKLQRQVDFLRNNPEYSICWTRYALLNNEGVQELDWTDPIFSKEPTLITLQNIFDINRTMTVTTLSRRAALQLEKLMLMKYGKDIVLYAIALCSGHGAILHFTSGHYRIHSTGIYSGVDEITRNYHNFLSIRELTEKFRAAETDYIRKKMRWSLETAIYLACRKSSDARTYQQVTEMHKALFEIAPLERRIVGYKELIKQFIRRIMYKISH